MRILLLSDFQEVGGAGIATGRLGDALREAGHEVVWLAGRLDQPPRFESQSYATTSGLSRAALALAQRFNETHHDAMRSRQLAQRVVELVNEINPDVVSVHNIHGMRLPADLTAKLAKRRPVVWTLHDMWAFTGTCAYNMGCESFTSQCTSDCSQHAAYPSLDSKRIPRAFEARRTALKRADKLAFVTPSRWLMHEAKRGILHDQYITAIANSVNLDVFSPMDRSEARRLLGIDAQGPVLFTTATTHDPRKGCDLLIGALNLINIKLTLVCFDASIVKSVSDRIKIYTPLATRDAKQLATIYAAADAHVLPTLADNLPNTLLEAAACGTPSIATDVGGVHEAIQADLTGFLCQPHNARELANTIKRAVDSIDNETPQHCRAFAERHFAPSVQAKNYTELFEQMKNPQAIAA